VRTLNGFYMQNDKQNIELALGRKMKGRDKK